MNGWNGIGWDWMGWDGWMNGWINRLLDDTGQDGYVCMGCGMNR